MFLEVPREAAKYLRQGRQSLYGGLKRRAPRYDTGMILVRLLLPTVFVMSEYYLFTAQCTCCPWTCTLQSGQDLLVKEIVLIHIMWSLFDQHVYRGADKSLARPTSRCILFDGENISFDAASLFIHINSTNIPPIMIINRIYETENLLPL